MKNMREKVKWKRLAAIGMALLLLPQIMEPLSASVREIEGSGTQQIDLMKVQGTGVDSNIFQSAVLAGQKKGELEALSLDFTLNRNTTGVPEIP